MAKIVQVTIEGCGKCPNLEDARPTYGVCAMTSRCVYLFGINEYCPLEDAPDNNEQEGHNGP